METHINGFPVSSPLPANVLQKTDVFFKRVGKYLEELLVKLLATHR